MDNDQPPDWLPLAEAAQRLGTTVDALRKRAKRGLVEVRKGNDGRLHVLVTGQTEAGHDPTDDLAELVQLRAEIERWRALAEERGIALARAEERAEAAQELVAELKAMLAAARRPWWRRWLA